MSLVVLIQLTMLKHSKLYAPLRDKPGVIALLKAHKGNATQQRRLLQG